MEKEAAEFTEFTRKNSWDLANKLETICNQDFLLDHQYPLLQAGNNYQYLPDFKNLSKKHPWIDLDYQVEFVKTIFSYWRERLKSYEEFYVSTGFMLILFEDFLSSLRVTAVAQTPDGSPYPYMKVVKDIRKVFEINATRTFNNEERNNIDPKEQRRILDVIEQNKGSIGKPSANQLKMKVGELRKLITNMDLGCYVNEIRKQNRKRPADFTNDMEKEDMEINVERIGWEGIVPPNF